MPPDAVGIIGGFDCHTDTHVAAALDPLGRLLGTASFAATPHGYDRALAWLRAFGPIIAVGVESTGSFGAALARSFADHGLRIIEVNQPHRYVKARRGKTDSIDAEAAARKVLSGEAAGAAKDTTGIVEAIRHLTVARDGAIKARAAALCQLGDLVITAPAAVRMQLKGRKTLEGKATWCARLRPDRADPSTPTAAAKLALRSIAKRIGHLSEEAAALDLQLASLVMRAAPRTRQQLGLGTQNTAALLIAAGENIARFRSEAAFAHLCAAAPVQASSGRTTRHRLNHGGNRAANRALHMTVIVRLRYCPRTRAYMQRRVAEGRTKKEIIRCLKRYLVRDVYRTLRADLSTLSTRP